MDVKSIWHPRNVKMLDHHTFKDINDDEQIRQLKIRNLEYGIKQAEKMISESRADSKTLIFLRKKISESIQSLETLYLMKKD